MCSMEELRQQCQSCQLCGLGATRKNLVFGDGNPDADVMFIGEGPGKQEDEQGIPFVGAAGQFLSRILENHRPRSQPLLYRQHRQVPPAQKP